MSFFEKYKVILKPKWLDYYENNRSWIKKVGAWVSTPDSGKRPSAEIVLGAISALEPRLAEWLFPFCQLNSDANKLVDLLGLHFDPDVELEKRAVELAVTQEAEIIPSLLDPDTEYLKKIREETIK